MILNEKLTYVKASQILNIKLSTAKLIVKRFKEKGTFFNPFEKEEHHLEDQERPR
jgi:transposase